MSKNPKGLGWVWMAAGVAVLPLILVACEEKSGAGGGKGAVVNKGKGRTPMKSRIALPTAKYVGTKDCLECHAEHVKSLEGTRHWMKNDTRTPIATKGCESCHGAGSAHIENADNNKKGEVVNLVTFGAESKFPADQQDAQCLACHEKTRSNFRGTGHHREGVGCANCHKVHGRSEKQLKTDNEVELCGSCHKNKRADIQKTSHHPLREGKMKCTDCHNPHGSNSAGEESLKAPTINDTCFKCHAEKRGPFMYQHPPVAEDCSKCHDAHGSISRFLLKAPMPFLCQRCHDESRHPGTLYAAQATFKGTYTDNTASPVSPSPSTRMVGRQCMNCHPAIHGSSHPSGKALTR